MSSGPGRWFSKRDRDKTQARSESSNQTSLLHSLFSSRGSRSPAARQNGGTSSGTPAPVASSGPQVQSANPVAELGTQEPDVSAGSSGRTATQYAKDAARLAFRVGAGAAEVFPPAKAVVAGLTEILKLIDVSFERLPSLHTESLTLPFSAFAEHEGQ